MNKGDGCLQKGKPALDLTDGKHLTTNLSRPNIEHIHIRAAGLCPRMTIHNHQHDCPNTPNPPYLHFDHPFHLFLLVPLIPLILEEVAYVDQQSKGAKNVEVD